MKIKYKAIVKDISFALVANVISLIISIIMNLIVPRRMGLQDFAYWQLYIFYSSYVIYLNFGWCDGIYLKYAGKSINYLNRENINYQIFFLSIYELIISLVIAYYAYFIFGDSVKYLVFILSLFSGIVFVLRITLQYVMQATNQIKRYSFTVIIDRIVFLISVSTLFLLGKEKFYHLVFADILAKIISLIASLMFCREIFKLSKLNMNINIKKVLVETKDLIKGGIKVISASFISILIVGAIRLSIIDNWGTVTFGKISLTLSISNMVTLFVGSISMVMFPILRNINLNSLKRAYPLLRTSLSVPILGILALYKPFYNYLSIWLPDYSDSLRYMAILLPITFFETKNNLILNNYLKTIRKESWILISNFITILLSFLLIYISVYRMNKLEYTVYSILFVIAFRSILTELILGVLIKIKLIKNIAMELFVISFFLISNNYIDSNISIILYLGVYLLYLLFIKNDIKALRLFAKSLNKSNDFT